MTVPVEEPYDRYEKARLIEELESVFEFAQLCRKSSTGSARDLFFFIEQMAVIDLIEEEEERYVSFRKYCSRYEQRKAFVEEIMDTSPNARFNAREFQIHFRMSRGAFYQLWSSIRNHEVFQKSPKAKKRQVESKYQLLVFLKYVGTQGNGISNQKASLMFPSCAGHFELIRD